MALKPWYKVVTPREDLRDGKPLDASEFAVHLDQVRDGRAPAVYQNPERFFERTFLTKGLTGVAAEVLRRLSGEKTETSAVFNMTTQFGGGKTTLLRCCITSPITARRQRIGMASPDCFRSPDSMRYLRLRSQHLSARNSIPLRGAEGRTELR